MYLALFLLNSSLALEANTWLIISVVFKRFLFLDTSWHFVNYLQWETASCTPSLPLNSSRWLSGFPDIETTHPKTECRSQIHLMDLEINCCHFINLQRLRQCNKGHWAFENEWNPKTMFFLKYLIRKLPNSQWEALEYKQVQALLWISSSPAAKLQNRCTRKDAAWFGRCPQSCCYMTSRKRWWAPMGHVDNTATWDIRACVK